MMNRRRHSVDIPISKALVSLRRVKSLRDPSTNSMSKFSALVENVNWETNSSNGISLQFLDSCGDIPDRKCHGSRPNDLCPYEQRGGHFDDFNCLGKSMLNFHENLELVGSTETSVDTKKAAELGYSEPFGQEVYRIESSSERYCRGHHMDRGLDLLCITPSINPLEDVESCNETAKDSLQLDTMDHTASGKVVQYESHLKPYGTFDGVTSSVGSPCSSASDAFSNHSTSLLANEDADVVYGSDNECTVSCCWTRTPRFMEANLSHGVEDHPLLSGNVKGASLYGKGSFEHTGKEITSYSDCSRSYSQKFRPNFFNELVGQNVVARSLLGAISKGRITSFYLFHGPRGTGKTSASRIFAAALNCVSLKEYGPCGICCPCVLFFSGRSRDVKEVDSVRINRNDRVRTLIKNAVSPPVSSRFKVFIFDECHLLHVETWTTVLNCIHKLSQHVVFIMITPDLDKLPPRVMSQSQIYHFSRIKDADIASRLEKICLEEDIDFDQAALDFIAAKSNGSLRDAEMMLEQLSLLDKKITMSLAHELIGIVSDDELVDLLDLALSSDTSNTVIRARELMRSRTDPMRLISQLANLIMDILADNCQEGCSQARTKFSSRHSSEVDLQKLSHALKVLSDAEKQLRMSKNKTTWLTVALLQLSSLESSSFDATIPNGLLENTHEKGESWMHLVSCPSKASKCRTLEVPDDCKGTLESIWKRAIELCKSPSLEKFLKKHGKLSFLSVNQGQAVADLEFCHPDYVSKAQKSWELIANLLQSILGCNVEIRITLVPNTSESKRVKVKKPCFSFFGCSRKMPTSQSSNEGRNDSGSSECNSEKRMLIERSTLTFSSDCDCQMRQRGCDKKDTRRMSGYAEQNGPSTRMTSSLQSLEDDTLKSGLLDSCDAAKHGSWVSYFREPNTRSNCFQPNCFPWTLMYKKKSRTSDASEIMYGSELQDKLAMSIPPKASFTTCTTSDVLVDSYCSAHNYANGSKAGSSRGDFRSLLLKKASNSA